MDRTRLLASASEFLFREADLLDRQDWDGWLALYRPDCVFWLPTWITDTRLCRDPETELSHIYYASRSGLEDRVWRIRSGMSVASLPMPRTMHAITNVRLGEASESAVTVESNIAVDVFSIKNQVSHRLFGRYEHQLVGAAGSWLIARKLIILLNDYLPSVIDIYSV